MDDGVCYIKKNIFKNTLKYMTHKNKQCYTKVEFK